MSEAEGNVAAAEAANADAEAATGSEGTEGGDAEGTTPEEVAEVLKGAGMKLPAEPTAPEEAEEEPAAPEAADDEEEGDLEEDTPAAPETDTDEEPVPAPEVTDDKYAFEVEDANGVTFKVTPDAKMEDILADFEPKNNGQIIDILSQLTDAKAALKADQAEAEKTAAAEAQSAKASELQATWQAEITNLTAANRIPKGEEGDKRTADVYKFMSQENDKRVEAGKPLLSSFEDALDKLENKEARDAKVAAEKAAKEERRANGGLVGGSSAPASGNSTVYKAGSARNANEALRAQGLL